MKVSRSFLLKGLNYEHNGTIFEVIEPLMMGRSRKCQVLLDDGLVSRCHSLFEIKDGKLYVSDLGSRNGTFVNQNKIEDVHPVEHGDIVRIGRLEFQVIIENKSKKLQFTDDLAVAEPVLKKTLMLDNGHFTLYGDKKQNTNSGFYQSQDQPVQSAQPQWFNVLFYINQEIQRQAETLEVSASVSDLLLEALDADRCVVALLNDEHDLEVLTARTSKSKSVKVQPSVQISRTIARQVLNERCALKVNDVRHDKRFDSSDSLILSEINSLIVAPIMISNHVLGLIEVSRADMMDAFTEDGLDLISIAGSMLGGAINHLEQIKQQQEHIRKLEDAQLKLKQAQDDLVRNEQLTVLGRMASSINHEIGNLLMPLLEYHSERMAKQEIVKQQDDDDALFTSEELSYSCTQIKNLIDDIKHFSKGIDRRPEMNRGDLATQVEKAVRFVKIDQELFPKSGINAIRISLEIKQRPKVIMDALQIGRVLINLLRNAAQAMHGQSRPAQIWIRLKSESDLAILEIEDNGPGIPGEIKEKMFQPFVSSKGEKGLGLGLDISRKIILNHSGHIEFETSTGLGTIFRITLPLNPTIRQSDLSQALRTPLAFEPTPSSAKTSE
jgi:C4-dicarboxylate-specific signal transduction histidine kinase